MEKDTWKFWLIFGYVLAMIIAVIEKPPIGFLLVTIGVSVIAVRSLFALHKEVSIKQKEFKDIYKTIDSMGFEIVVTLAVSVVAIMLWCMGFTSMWI